MPHEGLGTAGSRQGEHNARCYQSFFVDLGRRQNICVCLPTGSGKTFIAVQLTKEYLPEAIQKRQKIIMLEPTVALTRQQFQYFFSHLPDVNSCSSKEDKDKPHTVDYLTGDRDVDKWSGSNWDTFFNNCHVIVMTPQILVNALLHNFMTLDRISLLILDECHHASSGHPMAQIMEKYREERARRRPVPRVLGLTATIINGQKQPEYVATQVQEMEKSLCVKAATYREYEQVLKYATNATVEYVNLPARAPTYSWTFKSPYITKSLLEFKALVAVQDKSKFQKDRSKEVDHPSLLSKEQLYSTKKRGELKKFEAIVMDVLKVYEELGPYCARYAAMNKRVFVQSKNMEKFEYPIVGEFYEKLDEALKVFVEQIEQLMASVERKADKLTTFISEKIDKLLKVLVKYKPEPNENDEKVFCSILFVERRLTAQVLSWYLKDLTETESLPWSFIRPGFVMGCSNNELDAKEKQISPEEQARVLRDFRNGIYNLLVATSVVEEGLDVPICSLVIRFDQIKTYPSYVQSMGRARGKKSEFFAFVESDKEKVVYEKFHEFNAKLSAYLQNNAIHPENDDDDDNDGRLRYLNSKSIPDFTPYGPGKAPYITAERSLSLISEYCQTLLTDCFASFEPIAWHQNLGGEEEGTEMYKAYVQFPSNSVIREIVSGDVFPCKELAKRSAYLKACHLLFERGALSKDRLLPLPRRLKTPLLMKIIEESPRGKLVIEMEKQVTLKGKVGSKSQTNQYPKKIPDCLKVVDMKSRNRRIFQIIIEPEIASSGEMKGLNKTSTYGLLTNVDADLDLANIIPKFSLQLSNSLLLTATLQEISIQGEPPSDWFDGHFDYLEKFQRFIFGDVLQLQNGMLFNTGGNEPSPFLLVPLYKIEENEFMVRWDVIQQVSDVSDFSFSSGSPEIPGETLRRSFQFDPSDYDEDKIIFPWYDKEKQFYTASGLLNGSSLSTIHPDTQNMDVGTFFLSKYPQIRFFQDVNQHLILAQPLKLHNPESLNLFNPPEKRPAKAKAKKNKQTTGTILVPELVTIHPLPLSLFVQSKFLPSVLHRINRYLLAWEIQTMISGGKSASVNPSGILSSLRGYGEEQQYRKLMKEAALNVKENREKPESLVSAISKMKINTSGGKSVDKSSELLGEMTKTKLNFIHPSEYSDEATLKSYAAAIKSGRAARRARVLLSKNTEAVDTDFNNYGGKHLMRIHKLVDFDSLKSLKKYDMSFESSTFSSISSPSLFTIMQAITLQNARDFISLERLETIGDSFLKFAVTKFLYLNFPTWNEGRMSELKDFLISNAHLFGLGEKNLNLGEYLAGGIFCPGSPGAWLPPSFTVNRKLMEAAARNNVNEDIFIDENTEALLEFSDGALDEYIKMKKPRMGEIMKSKKQQGDDTTKLKPDNVGFMYARLTHKDIADSVEALVGAYYLGGGVKSAYEFLDKLGLKGSVNTKENSDILQYIPLHQCPKPELDFVEMETATVQKFLPAYKALENLIGYTFKQPWLLVQAFTHPCYMRNRVTPSYERLEFLGDGLLDFLITDHIAQNGSLSPGQLTDIRSALVNNVTFGSLAVRYGLHKYILHSSKILQDVIDGFVRYQEEHEHQVTGQFELMTDFECPLVKDVDMPKILGDSWEALAGAIFIDSGMSLDCVWRVFYRLMKNEIDLFSQNPPKSPVRRLKEKFPQVQQLFIDVTKEWRLVADPELMYMQVNLLVPPTKNSSSKSADPPIVGVGKSKKSAKLAVAKYAMKKLDEIACSA